ncbi:SNF2 family N-terminal domain-containing protein [Mycena olivaceomarginata]|nr:SNF2 family N-terminal domain-containing protein [Mycena olivaceomarginata]
MAALHPVCPTPSQKHSDTAVQQAFGEDSHSPGFERYLKSLTMPLNNVQLSDALVVFQLKSSHPMPPRKKNNIPTKKKVAAADVPLPRLGNERLSFVFYMFFGLPHDYHPIPTPRIIAAVIEANIPRFWETETAPAEHLTVWGHHWTSVRTSFLHNPEFLERATLLQITHFDWGQSSGLEAVYNADKQHQWARVLDPLFEHELQIRGRTIREMWELPEHACKRDNGMPASECWDDIEPTIYHALYGPTIGQRMFPHAVMSFWKHWLSHRLNEESGKLHQSKRNLITLQGRLQKLGVDPIDAKGRTLSPTPILSALELLREYRGELKWALLTDIDKTKLLKTVSSHDYKTHWEKLNPNAKAHEFCSRSLGWITAHFVPRIQPSESQLDPHLVPAYLRGQKMAELYAKTTSPRSGPLYLVAYKTEVFEFIDEWMGRVVPSCPDVFLDLLDGEIGISWQEATDIRTDFFPKITRPQLECWLGMHGPLPTGVRPQITGVRQASGLDIRKGLRLMDHQLMAVAIIIARLGQWHTAQHVTLEQVSSSPKALQEGWGRVPGTLLMDDKGLGKTLTCIATITILADLQQGNHPPAGPTPAVGKVPTIDHLPPFPPSFGVFESLPDARHLIICPPSLLYQWKVELQRCLTPSMSVVVVSSENKKQWESQIKEGVQLVTPLIRQIWLTTTMVVSRMAQNAVGGNTVSGRPSPKCPLRQTTLFAFSWATVVVDEAHQLCTGGVQFNDVDALLELGWLKLLLTPYIESPKDLLHMTRLLRAPKLGQSQEQDFAQKITLLQQHKTDARRENRVPAVDFMDARTTEPLVYQALKTHEQVTAGLIATLQSILNPHTIRRTNTSVDLAGKLITQDLPQFTRLHVCFGVTEDEKEKAALFEHAMDPDAPTSSKIEATSIDTHKASSFSAFYSLSRAYLGLPFEDAVSPDHCTTTSKPNSKQAILVELIKLLLRLGPEKVVPSHYHGTTINIIDQTELGIPLVHCATYKASKRLATARKPAIQILVYTGLAQFHDQMEKYLEYSGISTCEVNGDMATADCARVIERWKESPEVTVLLMSGGGLTELNLTNASVVILYGVPWASVISQKIYERINRHGQKDPTWAFQLVPNDTVEVYLTAVALGKGPTGEAFFEMHREFLSKYHEKCYNALSQSNEDELFSTDEKLQVQKPQRTAHWPAPKSRPSTNAPRPKAGKLMAPPCSDDNSSSSEDNNSTLRIPKADKGKGKALSTRLLTWHEEDDVSLVDLMKQESKKDKRQGESSTAAQQVNPDLQRLVELQCAALASFEHPGLSAASPAGSFDAAIVLAEKQLQSNTEQDICPDNQAVINVKALQSTPLPEQQLDLDNDEEAWAVLIGTEKGPGSTLIAPQFQEQQTSVHHPESDDDSTVLRDEADGMDFDPSKDLAEIWKNHKNDGKRPHPASHSSSPPEGRPPKNPRKEITISSSDDNNQSYPNQTPREQSSTFMQGIESNVHPDYQVTSPVPEDYGGEGDQHPSPAYRRSLTPPANIWPLHNRRTGMPEGLEDFEDNSSSSHVWSAGSPSPSPGRSRSMYSRQPEFKPDEREVVLEPEMWEPLPRPKRDRPVGKGNKKGVYKRR